MKFFSLFLFSLSVKGAVFDYQEVVRRYKGLDKLALADCEQSYRHVNDNWMDCQIVLPRLINSPVGQISNFNVQRRELITASPEGLDTVTRLETSYRDMDEASAFTRVHASSYYQRLGHRTIFEAPSSSYSSRILKEHVRSALAGWGPEETTIIAHDPSLSSPFIEDEVKGRVFFGEKTGSPEAGRCLMNYEHDQEDNWPDDEEIWFSQCSYHDDGNYLYLSLRSFWSEKLRARSLEETKLIPLAGGKIAKVTYSAEGFRVQLGNDTSTGPDFNLDLPKEEAEPLIREAAKKSGSMRAHFFVLERKATGLKAGERIIGKLVMKRTRMRDEIDLIETKAQAK